MNPLQISDQILQNLQILKPTWLPGQSRLKVVQELFGPDRLKIHHLGLSWLLLALMGSKMAPSWLQDAPGWQIFPNLASTWPKLASAWPQHGLNMAQHGPD